MKLDPGVAHRWALGQEPDKDCLQKGRKQNWGTFFPQICFRSFKSLSPVGVWEFKKAAGRQKKWPSVFVVFRKLRTEMVSSLHTGQNNKR